MEFNKLRVNTKGDEEKNKNSEYDSELEPVSPTTEYFLTEGVTVYILAIFQLQISVNLACIYDFLKNVFLNSHPRVSSIPVEEKNGKKKWKRMAVNISDHVTVPAFPEGLSAEDYSDHFDDYISKIATSKMSQKKPLWELHIFNHPTNNNNTVAGGTLILKFHHALGDGTSLMGLVFSCIQRDDDPSKPLTFPSRSTSSVNKMKQNVVYIVPRFMASLFRSFHHFGQSLKLFYTEDDTTPIRSGNKELRSHYRICTVVLSLIDVKTIKTILGVTINDVVVGIIFLGVRLYMQEMNHGQVRNTRSTISIALNLRNTKGYASLNEMRNDNAKVAWGNRFSSIELPIMNFDDKNIKDPIKFIMEAHNIIKRKKKTPFAQILLGSYLGAIRTCRGLQAAARMFERRTTNCSIIMTNMIGPTEKMSLAAHPVNAFYFIPIGLKPILTVSVMSYMQKLTIGLAVEKGFIDYQILTACVEKSFQLIFQAATSNSVAK